MAKKAKDYFGLDRIVSLILVIIPITSAVCGIVARIQDKHYVAAALRFLLGWNIIWILDIVFMVKDETIFRFLEV
ncbi:MAG: hypothetical protein J6T74_02845 [Clostridia bacterium]|nr:hypothetical protein [Clostridia bacterium]